MQRDVGSRDAEFVELLTSIRQELLRIAGVSKEAGYEAVLMQAVAPSASSRVFLGDPRPMASCWCSRMARTVNAFAIAERLKVDVRIQRWPENAAPDAETVRRLLAEEPAPTHLAIVHLETTTEFSIRSNRSLVS